MALQQPTLAAAPGAWPLLGHTTALLRRPLEFLESLPAHGKIVRIRAGGTDILVVCDLALTQQLLREDHIFDKGGKQFERAREIVGNGLFTCPHDAHIKQRRLLQPAFRRSLLSGYAQTMAEEATRTATSWQEGKPVDIPAHMQIYTTQVAVRTLFGTDSPPPERLDDIHTVLAGMFRRMLSPTWLNQLPTPGNRHYSQARTRLHDAIARIITDRQDRDTGIQDLLSSILATQDDGSAHHSAPPLTFTTEEVFDQVLTLLIGGADTAANTIAWALHLLAEHPDVEDRLHTEVDHVLQGRPPTLDDLPNLPLTGQVLSETLRLYPPGWFLTRQTTKPCQLGSTSLPAGTVLAFSPYLIHHMPEHFPQPHRFDPNRWAQPNNSAAPQSPNSAFLPFGGGRRKCIGDIFGLTEATIALATITTHWTLRHMPGTHPHTNVRFIIAPHNLHMHPTGRRFEPKTSSHLVSLR